MLVKTHELNDEQWIAERNAIAQRFLGVTAEEFVKRYNEGEYGDEVDGLMAVLAFFPELD
jgi:hypothetical protein